jgi:hypothetical protein
MSGPATIFSFEFSSNVMNSVDFKIELEPAPPILFVNLTHLII